MQGLQFYAGIERYDPTVCDTERWAAASAATLQRSQSERAKAVQMLSGTLLYTVQTLSSWFSSWHVRLQIRSPRFATWVGLSLVRVFLSKNSQYQPQQL